MSCAAGLMESRCYIPGVPDFHHEQCHHPHNPHWVPDLPSPALADEALSLQSPEGALQHFQPPPSVLVGSQHAPQAKQGELDETDHHRMQLPQHLQDPGGGFLEILGQGGMLHDLNVEVQAHVVQG